MSRLKRSTVLAVLTSLALAPAAAHADTSGSDIVSWLNAQRVANGLPGVSEDTAASAACLTYLQGGAQGAGPSGEWTWQDSPAPGYDEGPWSATNDPFERHPDELAMVLAPRLATFGAAVLNGRGCATFDAPGTRPAPAHDVTYAYPGDGATDVRTSQLRDDEIQPTDRFDETGPVLFAFFDGPDLDPRHPSATHVTSASLAGPDGTPVAIDARDFQNAFLPTEVRLVPRAGLAPFTTYHATVTADVTPPGGAARSFTKAWSFTTGALENAFALRAYGDFDVATRSTTGIYRATVASRAPQVTMTATGPGGTITQTATSADYWSSPAQFAMPLSPGLWHICYSSGGDGTDYRAASICQDNAEFGPQTTTPSVPSTPPAPLRAAAPPAARLVVSVAHGVRATWRGRSVSVPVQCSAACALRVAGAVRVGGRSVRLGSVRVTRSSAGAVVVKYTISKVLAARLRHAHVRKVALTIAPVGGGAGAAVRATLALTAAK